MYHMHYVANCLQYIGEMDDVPMSTDMSDRNFLLSTLDEQRVSDATAVLAY